MASKINGSRPLRVVNTDSFIKKSLMIHGDRYNYSTVDYKNSHHKVTIICPYHGEFLQSPNTHLGGAGCRKCGVEDRNKAVKLRKSQEFKVKSSKIHSNFYLYSDVDYCNSGTPVDIICPYHGVFIQTPDNHLAGKGCPTCAQAKRNKARTRSLEEFCSIAKERHPHGLYDYSNVSYTRSVEKVEIWCLVHNSPFFTTPANHLKGRGCPKCAKSVTDDKFIWNRQLLSKKTIELYHVEIYNESVVFEKIGITSRSVSERFKYLHLDGFQYRIIQKISGELPVIRELEDEILSSLENIGLRYRVRNLKNTRSGGWTECFPSGSISVNFDQMMYDSFP